MTGKRHLIGLGKGCRLHTQNLVLLVRRLVNGCVLELHRGDIGHNSLVIVLTGRNNLQLLIDGVEAIDHEAQTNFQKETHYKIRPALARSRAR